jgi:hypothetical protein
MTATRGAETRRGALVLGPCDDIQPELLPSPLCPGIDQAIGGNGDEGNADAGREATARVYLREGDQRFLA